MVAMNFLLSIGAVMTHHELRITFPFVVSLSNHEHGEKK